MGLGRCAGRRGGWEERVNKRHRSGIFWEEDGKQGRVGSGCERLHGKLDDGDGGDIE